MNKKEKFVFSTENYRLIIAGIIVSLIGFFLMIGGGSEDPNTFNADELFSPIRITVAPILVIAGYGLVIYGIMKKRKVN
jgi:uncharacterized membrane protein